MSTTTKNVGRVSIVPKGNWNINNTYIRLDLVTYDGNSYIAKKDVPKNIQLSNNNYWMLMASKGASFAIVKSYASIAAMNADFSNANVQNGQFVIIDTGNVQDPDNAKLYYKGSNNYVFVTDLSGAAGIQGPRGTSAYEQAVAGGYTGTEVQFNEDLANFKELSEQAADSAAAAARSESNAAGSATTATTKAQEATNSASTATAKAGEAATSAQAAANSATSAELNSSTAFEFAKQASGSKSAAALCVREAQGWVREAQAYAIGKRDDLDVSITDPAYHNNAKYYAEQAALVVNNVEQTMAATTISSATFATFNASIADMPFKGLTVDIEPVQDLHGYDHPWPEGGGKNKIPLTLTNLKARNTSGTWSGNTYTTNGVAFAVSANEDAVTAITVKGTNSTTNWVSFYIPITGLVNGESYVLNGTPAGGSSSKYRETLLSYGYDYGSSYSFTKNKDGNDTLSIDIAKKFTAQNIVFYPMIRLASVTDATFEPYSNICPITGWTGRKVARTGKNLIDAEPFTLIKSSARTKGIVLPQKIPVGTYSLSFDVTQNTTTKQVAFIVRDKTGGGAVNIGGINVPAGATGKFSETFEATEPIGYNYIFINSSDTDDATITFTNIQLERGSVTTAYEPYQGTTYNIIFPSEAGTVYGGTLDVANGKLTVTKGAHVFTGSESFSERLTGALGYILSPAALVTGNGSTTKADYLLCSHLATSSDYLALEERPNKVFPWKYGDDVYAVLGYPTGVTSAAEYKAYLQQQYSAETPVTVAYTLASPIEIPLSNVQIITTLLGTNNIWADTGDVTVIYGAYLETIKVYADQAAGSAATAETVLASIPDDYTELSNKINNLNNTFMAEYGVTTFNEIDTHVRDGDLVVLKQGGLLDNGSYYTVLSGTSFGEHAGFPWSAYIFTKPAVASGDTVNYTRIMCDSDNEWSTEYAEVRNINTDIVGTFYYANAYKIGDYVQQNNKIYRFVAPHTAGSYWNSSEVVEVILADEVSDLKSAVNDSVLYGNQPLGTLLENKYIGYQTGNLMNYDGWSATDFIPVINTNVLIINSPAGDSDGNYNGFYDSSKTHIPDSSFQFNVGETSINVPSNAAYYRMSAPTATMEQVTVKWWIANQLDNVIEGNQLTDPITALKRHTNMNGLDGNARTNHNDCFCLAHLSDIHLDGVRYRRFAQFCDSHPEINARICTGDFGNAPGVTYNGVTQENYMLGLEVPKKTLFVVGNHERTGKVDNVNYKFTQAEVFENWNLAQWYSETGVNASTLYYYKDFETSKYKIRLIVLNCCDADNSGDVLYYSQDQINWFVNLLNSTADDTAVIVATHFAESEIRPNDCGFYTRDNYFSIEYANTPVVENIIDAWRKGAVYSATNVYARRAIDHTVNVNADFTGKHGHFLAWLSGHMHRDRIGYSLAHPDQLILSIVNGGALRDEFLPTTQDLSNCSDLPRIVGKASEDGFNIYAFDPVNDIVKVLRIGSSLNDVMEIRKVSSFSTLGEIEEINYQTIIDQETGKKSFKPGLVAELADGTTHEFYKGYKIKGSNKIVETWTKLVIDKNSQIGVGENWAYIQANGLPKDEEYRDKIDADILEVTGYNFNYASILQRWPNAITGYWDSNTTYPNQNWLYLRADGTGRISTWLASNTVTVLYQLKTPSVYTLA